MSDRYTDPGSGTTIRRINVKGVGRGYVLTIKGNAGQTVLVIQDDGTMINASGEAIIRSDVTIAQLYLPKVGASSLVLRQGDRATPFFRRHCGGSAVAEAKIGSKIDGSGRRCAPLPAPPIF